MNRIGKYELMFIGITWLIIGVVATRVIAADIGILAKGINARRLLKFVSS